MYIYVNITDPLKGTQRLSTSMAFLFLKKNCFSQIQVINNATTMERKKSQKCFHFTKHA